MTIEPTAVVTPAPGHGVTRLTLFQPRLGRDCRGETDGHEEETEDEGGHRDARGQNHNFQNQPPTHLTLLTLSAQLFQDFQRELTTIKSDGTIIKDFEGKGEGNFGFAPVSVL